MFVELEKLPNFIGKMKLKTIDVSMPVVSIVLVL